MDLQRLSDIHIKHGISLSLVISLIASLIFPGGGSSSVIETLLVFIGILFGVIVGFFISDLYSRFQTIKENAAIDASGLATFYKYAEILADGKDTKWLKKQRTIIHKYVIKFMPLPWDEFSKTEKEFNELIDTLHDIKYHGDKKNETYSSMLSIISEISDAREKLVMNGEDHLTRGEWIVILLLGTLLLFSLYFVKTFEPVSILFTWMLSSSILILMLVIRDLNNLKFGETAISIKPYQRILDTIGKPRYKIDQTTKSRTRT